MLAETDLRSLTPDDLTAVGAIIHDSLATAHRDHGLLEPLAGAEQGAAIARTHLELDPAGAIVAERAGELLGAGFLHRRDAVASIGPLVVKPAAHGRGAGSCLLGKLVELADDCTTIRALVDSCATRAIGMACTRSFVVTDSALQLAALGGLRGPGRLLGQGAEETPDITESDLPEIAAFDSAGFGGSRERDLQLLLSGGEGLLLRSAGGVSGFLFGRVEESLGIIGPGAADSPEMLAILMARIGARLEKRATIIRTCLPTSQPLVIERAIRMGFRMTSTSLLLNRGEIQSHPRASVIGLPADVV